MVSSALQPELDGQQVAERPDALVEHGGRRGQQVVHLGYPGGGRLTRPAEDRAGRAGGPGRRPWPAEQASADVAAWPGEPDHQGSVVGEAGGLGRGDVVPGDDLRAA